MGQSGGGALYEVGSEMVSGETETPVAREDERENRERERMKEAFRELQGEIPAFQTILASAGDGGDGPPAAKRRWSADPKGVRSSSQPVEEESE